MRGFTSNIAIVALLTAPAWACTVVTSDRITGRDLAAENHGFAALEPDVDLGPAPLAGTQRVLRGFELERMADKHGLLLLASAPRVACFERASQTLNEAMLLPLLAGALAADPLPELSSDPTSAQDDTMGALPPDPSIEIVDFSHNRLPLGALEFKREGLSPSGLWRGRLLYGENRSVPVWVRVRIGDPETGEPVIAWKSSEAPEVRPGDIVEVEVRSGAVMLAFEAPAQSSGHVGETVLVRNPENGKRFRAVVQDVGKVLVSQ